MKTLSLDDDMLDAVQLGRVLKLDRRTIYRLVRNDGLPVVRLSRKCMRFDKHSVAAWLLKRRAA